MDPVIIIAWCIIGLLVGLQYGHCCNNLPNWKKFLCAMVFLVGGPFFVVAQVCEMILDILLPEGWDDDDERII